MVDKKGPTVAMVSSLANFIVACGLTHFVYRSDTEDSLKSLVVDAIREIRAEKCHYMPSSHFVRKGPDQANNHHQSKF